MENLDIVIYTVIVSVAFVIFLILSVREFTYMSKNKSKDGEGIDPYRRR